MNSSLDDETENVEEINLVSTYRWLVLCSVTRTWLIFFSNYLIPSMTRLTRSHFLCRPTLSLNMCSRWLMFRLAQPSARKDERHSRGQPDINCFASSVTTPSIYFLLPSSIILSRDELLSLLLFVLPLPLPLLPLDMSGRRSDLCRTDCIHVCAISICHGRPTVYM